MRKVILILLTYSLFTSISWGLVWPYITINIYALGSDFFRIVFVESFPAISYILSRIWGAISDYYRRRKIFIIIGYSSSAIPLILAGTVKVIDTLVLLILFFNFLVSIGLPAYYASLGIHGGREVYGYLQMVSSLGFTIGAMSLGPIYEESRQLGVYTTAAIVILTGILMLSLLYKEERSDVEVGPDLIDHLKSSVKFRLRASPQFKLLLVAVFIAWIAAYWDSGLLKVKLYDLLKQSVGNYSLVIGFGSGLLSIPASILAALTAKRYGGLSILSIGLLCYSMIIPILGLSHSLFIFIALYILPIWPFFWAGQYSLAYELSEKNFEGENIGTLMTITNLAALPALIGGLIADRSGLDPAILITTIFYISSLAMALYIGLRNKGN